MRFLVGLLILLSFSAKGQTYNFSHFDEKEIGASFIYDFDQNSKNHLYIATSKGLVHYDGLSFDINSNRKSLLDEFVHNIYIDSKDQIWIAYYKGGLSIQSEKGIQHINESIFVEDFFEDEQGETHVIAEGKTYILHKNKLSPVEEFDGKNKIIPIGKEQFLSLDAHGYLSFIDADGREKSVADSVLDIHANHHNYPFISLGESHITVYNPSQDGYPEIEIRISFDEIGLKTRVRSALMTESKVILGTEGDGLIEVFLNPGYKSYSIKRFTKENGLLADQINSLFIDSEQTLWIGSYGNGISFLPANRISTFGVTNNQLKNHVNSIAYLKGQLILATNDGISYLKEPDRFNFEALKGVEVRELSVRNDTLWLGTVKGLYYVYRDKLEAFQFPDLEVQPKMIHCIQFNASSIYVGTNDGLFIYDFKTKSALHITTIDGLAHNVIEHFIIDANRTFWFDSPNSPIYSYRNQEFVYHKDLEGFKSFNLSDIIETPKGDIWFATEGDGAFLYRDGEFRQFDQSMGLLSNYIYFIEFTQDSQLIFAHKNGLSVLNENQDNFEFLNSDYIPELQFIKPHSSYLSHSNYLWIGTANGSVRIPKINQLEEHYVPDLSFKSVNINHEPFPIGEDIHLPYEDYYLEIDFEAIVLKYAESISFEYKLEGFDQEWTKATSQQSLARYQSVKDGNYTFKVRLLLNGNETDKEIQMKIFVESPMWKKAWFYVIIFFFLILLFFSTIWVIHSRNKKIRYQLQKEVHRRTLDLVQKNYKIAGINAELEELSNQYLEAKNTAEEQTKLMTESIDYAQNIQKVLLRKKEYNDWINVFSEFYLLFKPKDIVSGDFYWGYRKDNYTYVVVADCTGHGVPGAMISMLGASFLGDIIQKETETNIILDVLREKIISGFGQSEESSLYDGMDISLFRLNTETLECQFSAAMNPLFLVRSKESPEASSEIFKTSGESDTHRVYTTPSDRQPIGYYYKMTPFRAFNFQLVKGDRIYLMSDGLVDQFGDNGKGKFKKKNLIKLMLELADKSAIEQKDRIWGAMVDWMGEHEQIDDITLIGLDI